MKGRLRTSDFRLQEGNSAKLLCIWNSLTVVSGYYYSETYAADFRQPSPLLKPEARSLKPKEKGEKHDI